MLYSERMDEESIKKRVAQLLDGAPTNTDRGFIQKLHSLVTGAITVTNAVYGPNSLQVKHLLKSADVASKPGSMAPLWQSCCGIVGVLQGLQADIESGVVGSLRGKLSGEILADMLSLARTILDETGDGAKNVGGVLVAAAYEDAMRKIADVHCGVTDPIKLQDILLVLKEKGVLEATPFTFAQGLLSFRNSALHAKWEKFDRSTVEGALSFVREIVLKYLS